MFFFISFYHIILFVFLSNSTFNLFYLLFIQQFGTQIFIFKVAQSSWGSERRNVLESLSVLNSYHGKQYVIFKLLRLFIKTLKIRGMVLVQITRNLPLVKRKSISIIWSAYLGVFTDRVYGCSQLLQNEGKCFLL